MPGIPTSGILECQFRLHFHCIYILALLPFQLPVNALWEATEKSLNRAAGSLPPTRDTLTAFQAASFSLAQPWPLWAIEGVSLSLMYMYIHDVYVKVVRAYCQATGKQLCPSNNLFHNLVDSSFPRLPSELLGRPCLLLTLWTKRLYIYGTQGWEMSWEHPSDLWSPAA